MIEALATTNTAIVSSETIDNQFTAQASDIFLAVLALI